MLGLLLRLLVSLGRFGLLLLGLGGFLLFLGLGRFFLFLSLGLHSEYLRKVADLIFLGDHVKDHVQLLVGEDLGIGLGLFKESGHDVRDLLGSDAKVCGDLL